MKLLLDFLPIILFFISFKWADGHKEQAALWVNEHLGFMVAGGAVGAQEAPVLLATVVVVIATVVLVAVQKLRGQKIEWMTWISLALVVVLGALTVYLKSETFIKWKPTGLYWAMALVLALGRWVFRKDLLKAMMGAQLQMPDVVWGRLNAMWVGFMTFMGVLNLVVAFNFPTDTWVNFKMFGALGLMLVFSLAQGLYVARHLPPAEGQGGKSS